MLKAMLSQGKSIAFSEPPATVWLSVLPISAHRVRLHHFSGEPQPKQGVGYVASRLCYLNDFVFYKSRL